MAGDTHDFDREDYEGAIVIRKIFTHLKFPSDGHSSLKRPDALEGDVTTQSRAFPSGVPLGRAYLW
jgi:hypothetical protein